MRTGQPPFFYLPDIQLVVVKKYLQDILTLSDKGDVLVYLGMDAN